MALESLRDILGWCALIDIGLLLWWYLMFTFAHDWVYRVHSKTFKLSVEQFDTIHYFSMGLLKLLMLVFNLVPYLALRIVG